MHILNFFIPSLPLLPGVLPVDPHNSAGHVRAPAPEDQHVSSERDAGGADCGEQAVGR